MPVLPRQVVQRGVQRYRDPQQQLTGIGIKLRLCHTFQRRHDRIHSARHDLPVIAWFFRRFQLGHVDMDLLRILTPGFEPGLTHNAFQFPGQSRREIESAEPQLALIR